MPKIFAFEGVRKSLILLGGLQAIYESAKTHLRLSSVGQPETIYWNSDSFRNNRRFQDKCKIGLLKGDQTKRLGNPNLKNGLGRKKFKKDQFAGLQTLKIL